MLELDKTDTIFNRLASQQQEWFNYSSLNLFNHIGNALLFFIVNRLQVNSQNYERCLNECDTTIFALQEHSAVLETKKAEYDVIAAQHRAEIEKAKHYGEVLLKNKQVVFAHV